MTSLQGSFVGREVQLARNGEAEALRHHPTSLATQLTPAQLRYWFERQVHSAMFLNAAYVP